MSETKQRVTPEKTRVPLRNLKDHVKDWSVGTDIDSKYYNESVEFKNLISSGKEIPLEYQQFIPPNIQRRLDEGIQPSRQQLESMGRRFISTKREMAFEKSQTPEARQQTINSLQKAFVDVANFQTEYEDNLTTTERARVQNENSLDVKKNELDLKKQLNATDEQIKDIVEKGNLSYDQAWAYLYSKGNPKKELDWLDYITSAQVGESGAEKLPGIGSAFMIYNMHLVQSAIERIDLASGEEEFYTEQMKKDLAKVVNFYGAMEADRSFGNKLLGSLNQFVEFILLRNVGSKPMTARGQAVSTSFNKGMKKALTKVASKEFQEKLAKLSTSKSLKAKVAKGVAREAKVGVKGFSLMTTAEAQQMKTADMTLLKAETSDDTGYEYVYNLDFKSPKETYNYALSAIGNTSINMLSERFGSFLKALPVPKNDALGKLINGALMRSYVKKNPKANVGKVVSYLDNSNIDSIFSEVLEERLASVAVGALGVDQVGQEISPGFRVENEEGDLEFKPKELLVPTLEDFMVELATIGLGSTARQASQAYANRSAFPNMVISPSADTDQVKIVASDLVKKFTNNRDGIPGPLDAILYRTAQYNERLDGRRSIKHIPSKLTDPNYIKKARERGSEMITKDLVDFLENNPELEEVSFGWYGDNYRQAKEELSRGPLPELSDPNSEDYFTFLVAITSPQKDPELNTKTAIKAFIQSERGRTDLPTGLSTAQNGIVKNYNKLLDHLGSHNEVAKFLTSKMTGEAMRKKLWEYGLVKENKGSLKNGITMDEEAYVAEFFGPKVGAFYLNLMGIENVATIDLWMYRALSSALGEPIHNMNYSQVMKLYDKASKKKILKVDKKGKPVLDEDGKKQYTIGEKLDLSTIKVPDLDKEGKQKIDKKTKKPVYKAIKLVESASQRKRLKLYREVVEEIQQDFNKATGKNWTVAQVQAGIWYMEKHIFTANNVDGAKVGTSDYLSVAESIVDLGEVYDEKTRRTIRTAKEARDEIGAEERRLKLSRSNQPGQIQEETPTDNPEQRSESESEDGSSLADGREDNEETAESESNLSPEDVRGTKLGLKKQIDKDALNKKAPNLLYKEVPEVVVLDNETQAETFYENLIKFKNGNIWGGAVTLHDLEYYRDGVDKDGMIYGKPLLLQSYDGNAGSAIVSITNKKTGETVIDIQSVFNTHKTQDKKAFFSGTEMMRKSIIEAVKMQKRMGADKVVLDCYDGYLPAFYETFGFVETARYDWDDQYAKPDFPYANYKRFMPNIKDGKPQIVEMEWNPAVAREDPESGYNNRLGLEGSARVEEQSISGHLRRLIQNRLNRLFDYKSSFEKSTGRRMFESEDFATEARLVGNRAIDKIERVLDSLVNRQGTGFYQRMAKDGVSEEDLNLYLHALHTKERNKLVEQRTEGNGAVGSGLNINGELMTNKKAQEIIDHYETIVDGKPGKVVDYAKEFKIKYIQRAVQVMEQGGLINRRTADIFLNRNVGDAKTRKQLEKDGVAVFSNYITLNVDMEADHTLGGLDLNGGSKGFGLNGPEGFGIKGSKNDLQRLNPVQQTIESLIQKITRAENNQVNMKLLNAMRAVDFKTEVNGELVNAVDVQERDPEDGTAYNDELGHRVYTNTKSLDDNQILAKEDGVEYIITINDPYLSKAMQNVSPIFGSPIWDALTAFGNYTKMWITSKNPSFWIGNFQADLIGGILNISTQEGAGMAKEVAGSSFSAVRGIWDSVRDPENYDNEWATYYQRMKSAGGKVSFYNPKDYEDRFKDLDKRMRNLNKSGKEKSALKAVSNYIGDINDAIEGGIRLATFRSAVDRGYSDSESAILARDITIDFNSKGEWGRGIEIAYRFGSVGVQGVYRTGKAFKDNPKMAGVIGSGLTTTALILADFNSDWDEEEWESLSEFEKDNYTFIPNFALGKGFIRWRNPYGWGVFQTLGTIGSEMNKEVSLLKEGEELNTGYYVGRMLNAVGHNFVPIPTNVLPTIPGQITQAFMTGEDAIGRKFKPYKYNPESSDLETYYPDTPEWSKTFAYIASNVPFPGNPNIPTGNFNEKTQQIEWKPQGIDISPNEIEFLFSQVFGGVFTDINSIIKSAEGGVPTDAYRKIIGEESGTDWTKVPMIRKLLKYNPNRDIDQTRFFRLSSKSRKNKLTINELEVLQQSLDNLYKDEKVSLKEYNKMWDRIYDNEADRLKVSNVIRRDVKDKNSWVLPNPKYTGYSISGYKSEPRYKGEQRGNLSETLDLLEKEKERRKN